MNREHKNKLIGFCLLLLLSVSATAQVRFGVRTGGSYSSLSYKMEGMYHSGSHFGYNVGLLCDLPLKKNFSFRPELLFLNQGGNYRTRRYEKENGLNIPLVKTSYYSVQMQSNFAYNILLSDMNLSFMVGPAVDYSLWGEMTSQGTHHALLIGTKETEDYVPVNLSVNVGLAAEYNNLFFQVNAMLGLTDRQAVRLEGESAVLQNNVNFSIGYFFH